jgi:hypothetical protein
MWRSICFVREEERGKITGGKFTRGAYISQSSQGRQCGVGSGSERFTIFNTPSCKCLKDGVFFFFLFVFERERERERHGKCVYKMKASDFLLISVAYCKIACRHG